MIEIIPNWHPVFVHFTVALLSIGILFYCLTVVVGSTETRDQWIIVARWNLWLGSGFAVLTAIFGWLAVDSVDHDTPSHLAMITHRNWALATLVLVVPLALWSLAKHREDGDISLGFIAVLIIVQGLLLSTAWHGGELVYRHGLGVMSLPEAEAGGHAHADGQGHDHGQADAMMDGDADQTHDGHAFEVMYDDSGGHGHTEEFGSAAEGHPDNGHDY